ncbi:MULTISPECIES: TIR domain-containing protein [Halomonadaceae]|uniref:TIR domain-containing protein n=1 Tax=Vreelandella piezotolerans TaxID=2609667 RepID=A0ABQ6X5Z1_9GAMM|nr:TIR domain-containing protein [Halomonas piezotolerans]KAE8437446.1 TIR domain-containing protein [Halomonas piezotolerans]QJA24823.1 TIR domain-containing protein [Halomonas piezotolerans]
MLFEEANVKKRAQEEKSKYFFKSESEILTESLESFDENKNYNIFLSHSLNDADIILGIKGILEDLQYSVYVDWIEDPFLDRERVNRNTAEALKNRMKSCDSLFYITTENSFHSKWMPWECGFFDGFKGKVAITPVVKKSYDNDFKGQEYLGLYPYSVKQKSKSGRDVLFIFKNNSTYATYDHWVSSKNEHIEWKDM